MFSLQTTSPAKSDSRLIWGYYLTAATLTFSLTLGMVLGPSHYLIAETTRTFHPFFSPPGLTNAIVEVAGAGIVLAILWIIIPGGVTLAQGIIDALFLGTTNKDQDKHLGTTRAGILAAVVGGGLLTIAQLPLFGEVVGFQIPHFSPSYWVFLVLPSVGTVVWAFVATDGQATPTNKLGTDGTPSANQNEAHGRKQRQRTGSGDEDDVDEHEFTWKIPEGPGFEQVGGYPEVKEQFHSEVTDAVQDTTGAYERFDVTPPTGILLHGPPGTGKSLIGRSLAEELGVPYTELTQADLSSKWVNETPELIQSLFEEATSFEQAVVFIDEIDGLLRKRGGSGHAEDAKGVNEFLPRLAENDDIIVIAATNRKDVLDDAAIRSGRFDLHIKMGLPDQEAREEILRVHLEGRHNDLDESDITQLARMSDGLSGADLEASVISAAREAASENSSTLEKHHIKEQI